MERPQHRRAGVVVNERRRVGGWLRPPWERTGVINGIIEHRNNRFVSPNLGASISSFGKPK
jgi:hypothetical protein